MVSKKKAETNNKWTDSNMKVFAVKVKNETAEEFTRLCVANGETPYSVLRNAIEKYIELNKPM